MSKYIKDPLDSRIKQFYEFRDRHYLTRRMPVIIRVDLRAGHSYTAPLKDRFDPNCLVMRCKRCAFKRGTTGMTYLLAGEKVDV